MISALFISTPLKVEPVKIVRGSLASDIMFIVGLGRKLVSVIDFPIICSGTGAKFQFFVVQPV